jgi:hypothetical protein
MGLSCMTGQLYACIRYRGKEKAGLGDKSDPSFRGNGWSDMAEFGRPTVGKAMYDFEQRSTVCVALSRTVDEQF